MSQRMNYHAASPARMKALGAVPADMFASRGCPRSWSISCSCACPRSMDAPIASTCIRAIFSRPKFLSSTSCWSPHGAVLITSGPHTVITEFTREIGGAHENDSHPGGGGADRRRRLGAERGAVAAAGITRTDLLRHDLRLGARGDPSARRFCSGVAFPPHSHPGEEIAYVIEGLLEYRLDGRPPVTLKAGEVLFIPAGTIHSAKNVGGGNAAGACRLVEKGKPLVAFGPVGASVK